MSLIVMTRDNDMTLLNIAQHHSDNDMTLLNIAQHHSRDQYLGEEYIFSTTQLYQASIIGVKDRKYTYISLSLSVSELFGRYYLEE